VAFRWRHRLGQPAIRAFGGEVFRPGRRGSASGKQLVDYGTDVCLAVAESRRTEQRVELPLQHHELYVWHVSSGAIAMITASASSLQAFCRRLLEAHDVPAEEAQTVARHLVASNLAGVDSHGVLQLPRYIGYVVEGKAVPGAPLEVVSESPSSAALDAHWAFGQVAASRAMRMAIEKARATGAGVITCRNSNHVGRLADYVQMAAETQMIGMATVNNHGGGVLMAVFGGIGPRLGPNPIAFGVPARRHPPLILDISTAVVAAGQVTVRAQRGEQCPEGWLMDPQGNPTTDPNVLRADPRGALLPLGGPQGHKGYGLCLVTDLLAGALSGAGCTRDPAIHPGNGVFLVAIDVAQVRPVDEFLEEVDAFIDYVKASPRAPGVEEILVPGDLERRTCERRSQEGIPIPEALWKQLEDLGQAAGVEMPQTI
jgi:uncharacterized oxidoreductase